MRVPTCKDCKYFVLHYTMLSDSYVPAGMGHCTFMRLRMRKSNAKKCESFVDANCID